MITKKKRYFALYKPYGVICQFSPMADKVTLAQFGPFPKDVYPAGRLDTDSEGLVLLTNDGALKHTLLEPRYGHRRTYLVQVEGLPEESDIEKLRRGVVIESKKTRSAEVRRLDAEPGLPPRSVPIRYRKSIPTSWIEIVLREGRNRQVRKMTAAVGHPALRLVRTAIEDLALEGLNPGESRELSSAEIRKLLRLVNTA